MTVDPASMFDVQVKRIHEYKRQLLNVLHIVHEYLCLMRGWQGADRAQDVPLRRQGGAGLLGGQADHQADQRASDWSINTDPRVDGQIKVVFVPDYRVSLAEDHPGART